MQWEQLYGEGGNEAPSPSRQTSLFGQDDIPDEGKMETIDDIIAEKSPAHYQYKDKYIMTAVKSGLMIIDQRRAHLRVLYEEYLEKMDKHRWETQNVLFPEILQFSKADALVVERMKDELAGIGFSISSLGGNSFSVNGVPAGIEGVDTSELLKNIIDAAAQMTVSAKNEINSLLALTMARSAAISQGQPLSNMEMENLVNRLFACSNVNVTPDGKPILCILRQTEIEQMLG